jgi:murein L,D-transpeptidase YcbB/YkuD
VDDDRGRRRDRTARGAADDASLKVPLGAFARSIEASGRPSAGHEDAALSVYDVVLAARLAAQRAEEHPRRSSIRGARSAHLFVVALILLAVGASSEGAGSSGSNEIAAIVTAKATAAASTHREWIERIYRSQNGDPVWFTPRGVRPAVAIALRQLRAAGERGLAATDYDVDRLEADIEAATRPDRSPEIVARADVAMTIAIVQFLSDLHSGRVRPQDIEPHYRAPAKDAFFVAALPGAVASDRLAALIDETEPSFPLYKRLKRLLASYQALAARPPILLPPLSPHRTKVAPGDRYPGVPALHELLVRLGDLPPDAARPVDERYSNALAAAVARFQERHGLAPDGIVGKRTLAGLGVPVDARVRQIELSLERLRWLPELPPGPLIAINVPSFRLWGFADARLADRAALSMPVIVGNAIRGETPMFIGAMRYVEFSPYWNVPPNILRNELLPQLARDPTLLQRDEMELVGASRAGPATTVIDDLALAGLRSGELRLRQRPGAKNALGGAKFVLPNAMQVYLHGTPARELFERTRRDFSHGCIRVREPAALALFVLHDQPEWTPATIDAAMNSGFSRTVKLTAPISVVVFYTTAIVDAEGHAHFLPDVYGHDLELAGALRSSRKTAR